LTTITPALLKLLAKQNDMTIKLECQKTKNFLHFYKRFNNPGGVRSKSKKIELKDDEFIILSVERVAREISAFLFMD
jgi:hypothetical protein